MNVIYKIHILTLRPLLPVSDRLSEMISRAGDTLCLPDSLMYIFFACN